MGLSTIVCYQNVENTDHPVELARYGWKLFKKICSDLTSCWDDQVT